MSTTVDQRVVEMRFDNQQFESNVQTTMSTLDKFKQRLNLSGASKGLENVGEAAKRVDMGVLGNSIQAISSKFSALEVMGVTALANITNSAVNTGKRMLSALTIDPIKTGFQEYETQINAVQTILANTSHAGTDIKDVNRVLDELNTYADKTIYNFTEMTRNIGTFTAAGVDLDTSASAIQGIANLAAVSGSTSQQASTAMYQLSQAIAAGKVGLQDWNSVVNAGMGGKVFQDALVKTAAAMQGVTEETFRAKNITGSFRESISGKDGTGWLTSDVLLKALEQFTMAAEEGSEQWNEYKKSLMGDGYTEAQAEEILRMANTATDAATKVKTFTQLWDTLKESAQSGWTQSWEIVVGDFEQAKEMLSSVSDALGEIINKSAESRNQVLEGWAQLGGREDLLAGFKNVFEGIKSVVKPVKEAFNEIFPTNASEQINKLRDFSEGFKNLTSKLILSGDTADKIKSIFKGVFSIFDIGRKILTSFSEAILKLAGSDGMTSFSTFLLDSLVSLSDFFTEINKGFQTDGLTGFLSAMASGISNILESTVGKINGFGDALAAIGRFVVNVAKGIWNTVEPVFTWIRENVKASDIFAGLAGGGVFMAAKKLSGFLDGIIDAIKGIFGGDDEGGGLSDIKEKLGDILGSLHDSLNAFATGIKIGSIVSIAVSVGILTASLRSISDLDMTSIIKSLSSIGIMLGMLTWTMSSITKTLEKYGSKGLIKSGVSLIFVSTAILILSKAMEKIGSLPLKDIGKGLIGIGGGLVALSAALKIIDKVKIPLSTSVAMIALAESCSILGDAIHKFSDMTWDEIGHGLAGMGGALAELVVAMGILSKFGGFSSLLGSVGILIAVQSLKEMADGLKSFAEMTWDEIERGLAGMGGALGELSISLGLLGKIAGFSSIFAAGAILMVTQGLSDIAAALKEFGDMTWEEIGRGLAGMGGALLEVSLITGALGVIAGFSGLLASGAILITIQGLSDLADALQKFGDMTWEEIGRGLAGMGGALAEVGIITGALGALTGLSGLLGAGTLLLAVQSLGKLAESFVIFGDMTWEEIKRGLVGMGGALAEVGIVAGLLGGLTGPLGLVGAGSLLLGIQGLGDLADALKKFGEMSWSEIERGLSAMGGALGEVALGGFLNTLSGIGALSITEISESLGVLADSVSKWKDVTVPDTLGEQLGTLAKGVGKFTLAGLGSGALSEVAAPLGILAESINKWKDVVIPEGIGEKLETLGDGVKKFSLAGLGAAALAESAPGIGILADSVKKWKDVTVPEGLEDNMGALANGVKAFSFAFAGGWSIGALVTPLANLPDSIKKWTDITIPEGLEENMKSLANGVKAFSFAFAGGWSMEAVIGPLGELPDSIKKWSDVAIPEDLGSGLTSVANGVKSFYMTGDVSYAPTMLNSLADAIQRFSGFNYQGISSGIDGLIKSLSGLGKIGSMDSSVSTLGNSIVNGILAPISKSGSKFSEAGSKLIASLSKGMQSKTTSLLSVCTSLTNIMLNRMNASHPRFQTAGAKLMSSVGDGVKSKKGVVSSAFLAALLNSLTKIKAYYDSFYSSGAYLVEGFVSGMDSMSYAVEDKARAMAQAALDAIDELLGINSPAVEGHVRGAYYGEGFAEGEIEAADMVRSAATELGEAALEGLDATITQGNNDILEKQKEFASESIVIEQAYWDDLLAVKNEGIDKSKQKLMTQAEFEKEILDQTVDIWSEYVSALESGRDGFMGNSIFEAVNTQSAVSKDTLAKNLQDQVNQLYVFANTLTSVNSRIGEGAFKDSINKLGVDSLAQLQAINSMTDVELSNYVALYDEKYALATHAASLQLGTLEQETTTKLSSLYGGVDVQLSEFGKTFDGTMTSIKKYVQMSIDQSKVAKDTGKQIVEGLAKGISENKSANDAAVNMINSAEQAARTAADINSPSGLFKKEVGEYITEGVAVGMTDRIPMVTQSSNDIIDGAITPFNGTDDEFMTIGQRIVEGFVAGITSCIDMAASAAASMASAASEAARAALDIHSPSRVFDGIGGYAGEGFINALYRYADASYAAGNTIATSAKRGLTDAVRRISDILIGDVNVNPVISPVLDLNGVRTGVHAINGMLNIGSTIGIGANTAVISSRVDGIQNGGNAEVISAINGLKSALGKVGGNTYNSINGITYDDGSNIADAIRTIANAALVGRRM